MTTSMTTSTAPPRMEDLASVGTRISWGAILAGAMIALGMYLLLSTLATAVGMSVSDRVSPTKVEIGAVVWAFLTTAVALFLGGVVTSLFTAGENKCEAMLYGAIMWAVLVVLLLVLGTIGVRTGFNAMAAAAHTAQMEPSTVPASGTNRDGTAAPVGTTVQDPEARKAVLEASTRISWYVFAGTWISMLSAVAGSLVGAGPTFRVVTLSPGQRVVVT